MHGHFFSMTMERKIKYKFKKLKKKRKLVHTSTLKKEKENHTITSIYISRKKWKKSNSIVIFKKYKLGMERNFLNLIKDICKKKNNNNTVQIFHVHFIALCRYCIFYKLKSCDNQCQRNVFSNSVCSLCVSRPYFGNSWNILHFFISIVFIMVICGQSSLMLQL